MQSELPVVVIGGGPQGLAAAAHLANRGIPVIVVEAGPTAAAAVAEWGHVRLFSAWSELVDREAALLLGRSGWKAPAVGYPTGSQWVSSYLEPLAVALGDRVRLGSKVTGVSRRGRDRLVSAGRSEQPFTVHVEQADGVEYRVGARAVIDASGTWSMPNPAGADGLPALGERAAASVLTYRIPDYRERAAFAGKHCVVVGAGHSALTAAIALGRLARRDPTTSVSWVIRRDSLGHAFGGGDADELVERGQLGITAKEFVEAGLIRVETGFRLEEVQMASGRAVLIAEDGRALAPADHVAVLTGFRPDLSILSEVRLQLDDTLQAPVGIAADVDPNLHSCGSVAATGAKDLEQPDSGFHLVGAKSYGRAPTFLAITGYEQVRSVVAHIAGDVEAAARIELVLPETGVCGGAGLFDSTGASLGGSCCAPPSVQSVSIGRAPVGS